MLGVDLQAVNQVIINNPNLTHLGLAGVAIDRLDQLMIFDAGYQIRYQLVELDVSNSGIVDFSMIRELSSLQILNVSGNAITDSNQFFEAEQLMELDLSNNNLIYVLPLGELYNLTQLDLRGNSDIPCVELDELELRFRPEVLIRPADCLVGMPPSIVIDSPSQNLEFYSTELIYFTAFADDAENGDLSGEIQWSSNLLGSIGSGQMFEAMLAAGNHVITASVVDFDRNSAANSVQVQVILNTAAVLTIDSTLDGSTFQNGEAFTLSATASDAEEGNIGASIRWQSNLDGDLGLGTQLEAFLSVGVHTISASVRDAGGINVVETISLQINAAPIVELLLPTSGALFMLGEAVDLNASAIDAEDGNISGAIQWSSDLDGELGSGEKLSAMLSLGTHTISASVTDTNGGTHSVSTQLVIDQITLKVTVSGSGKRQKAKLTWSGSRTDVYIYKDDRKRRTGGPNGSKTFRFKNQAVFKVCEKETDYCSLEVTVQVN